jgi:2'-5' RNA ligase
MRLFVAIDIPDSVRSALAATSLQLRKLCPAVRWARIEGAHVTLKFIGEVQPERLAQIQLALRGVSGVAPVDLQFTGLGFFPNLHHPRVLWAGVSATPALRALALSVGTALEPLGIASDTRGFTPHITLARINSPKGLDTLRDAVARESHTTFGKSSAREFHLYRSVLKPGGAEYTRLSTYEISGEPAH